MGETLSQHRERWTIRLKCWPEPFQAVVEGRKPYEIRVNDRGYQVGDVLELAEWDPKFARTAQGGALVSGGDFTGREVRKLVTYMTPGGAWGLPANLCVLGLADLDSALPGPGEGR